MDYFSVLGSINIIAALCFFIALGFISYETVMYFKERGQVRKVSVPKFDANSQTKIIVPTVQQSKSVKPLVFHSGRRLIPILVAFLFLVATGLVAWKFNTSEPIETTVVSRNSNADFKSQSIIPTALPTQEPSALPTSEQVEPTQTLLAAAQPTHTPAPTTNQITPTPTASAIVIASSSATTSTSAPTSSQTLPEAGTSYHYIFILALAGASVVIMSLLF